MSRTLLSSYKQTGCWLDRVTEPAGQQHLPHGYLSCMKTFFNLLIALLLAGNVTVMSLTMISLLGGCRPEGESDAVPALPAGQDPAIVAQVPPPARAYLDAVNRNNLDSLVLAFAEGGAVLDVSRRITGRPAIRGWASNEVMGGTLRVLAVEQQTPSRVRLLVHWAPRNSAGWRAYYTFVYENGLITLADLQYA